jgi:soluble lytic murein transglycosylase-like protein
LDATGYYKRYSRALKGYPNLRSKTQQEPMRKPRRFNAQNRERYRTHVDRIARTYRLDPKLIDAVIIVESAYEPEAVSSKGAKGLMQLMPDTAKRFDVSDPFNPIANLHGGARYLRLLLDRFDNDVKLALAAYNAGENAVDDYGGKVPPYEETRTYVSRVLKLYAAYGD